MKLIDLLCLVLYNSTVASYSQRYDLLQQAFFCLHDEEKGRLEELVSFFLVMQNNNLSVDEAHERKVQDMTSNAQTNVIERSSSIPFTHGAVTMKVTLQPEGDVQVVHADELADTLSGTFTQTVAGLTLKLASKVEPATSPKDTRKQCNSGYWITIGGYEMHLMVTLTTEDGYSFPAWEFAAFVENLSPQVAYSVLKQVEQVTRYRRP